MNKEYGSDFHYVADYPVLENEMFLEDFLGKDYQLHFSGRTALYSVIENGIRNLGWKKIYVPEYFCHDVIEYIRCLNIDVFYYEDGPYTVRFDSDQFAEYDTSDVAILVVNYFGCQQPKVLNVEEAFVIEDHTHHPVSDWALNSEADFCIASLRKVMPIPMGGVLWSPKKNNLPVVRDNNTEFRNSCFFMKLSAMFLKAKYLKGENVVKQEFRDLFATSEAMLSDSNMQGVLPEFGNQLIKHVPLNSLNRAKSRNLKLLQELIGTEFEILQGDGLPIGLLILNDSKETRDRLRAYLAEHKIYTAVLWPSQPTAKGADFSERMLMMHVDARYDTLAIEYMADVLRSWRQPEAFEADTFNTIHSERSI